MKIEDKCRQAFNQLVSEGIAETINSSCCIGDNYEIEFKSFPILTNNIISVDGTDFIPIRASCQLRNLVTGECIDFIVDLLNLPVFKELGFRIKGNYMQMLDLYDRTPGWSFSLKNDKDGRFPEIKAIALGIDKRSFSFMYNYREIALVQFKSKTSKNDKSDLSISTFFRALTGMSNSELLDIFGWDNPFVMAAFSENKRALVEGKEHVLKNRNDCIEALANACIGKERANKLTTVSLKYREIMNLLFHKHYFSFGKGNLDRLQYTQSYRHRAMNKILAEDVMLNGIKFASGTILTDSELALFDHSDISVLKVLHNGKQYNLRKFSIFSFQALGFILQEDLPDLGIQKGKELEVSDLDAIYKSERTTLLVSYSKKDKQIIQMERRISAEELTLDDLYTVTSIWFDNLNGYDTFDNQYELTNRIVTPFDVMVKNLIQQHLNQIVFQLSAKTHNADVIDSVAYLIPDFSKSIDCNAFINAVALVDNREGQMSDMCNILSFTSKSNKVTSTIKSDNITESLVNVQDLQEGRLDSFDIPESDKIGIVHHKTALTKIDDSGYLTVPYLTVNNGKTVSEDPVYLTAIEESGKYIAEWNETFQLEDGSLKKRVKARYNGNVVTAACNLVTLKEFSPVQSMSPAHAMIPFPGHNNGKRITMGCNQQKQAMPLLNPERPYVGTGMESMLDVGVYTVQDALKNFYTNTVAIQPSILQYKKEIMGSSLTLIDIISANGMRTLNMRINALAVIKETTDLMCDTILQVTFPFLLKNFENGLFTYKINHKPNGIYSCDEVIAYNNAYSLENPERLELLDYGGLKLDTKNLERGTALGTNLVVAFKTSSGSTIDDAIVINSKLAFDNTLSSIMLYSVVEELHTDADRAEEFASDGSIAYFDYNGLPKIGTLLSQGDKAISKIVTRGEKVTVKYTRLSPYTEGQVISAEIKEKNQKVYAEVILALCADIEVGDKLAGRYGNKGVIAKILPNEQMPYDPVTGMVADIILNPLGIPSRQHISPLLEAALAMCMKIDGKIALVSPYCKNDLDFVREQARGHHVHPTKLIDGRTGHFFERPINLGVIYMHKLEHMASKKIHAIGTNVPVDPVFLQPRKGSKNNGGQAFGEMESWCLECVGAKHILQDFYSFQSDDAATRRSVEHSLLAGEAVTSSGVNHNDKALQACFRSMCIEIRSNEKEDCYEFLPLCNDSIRSFSFKPVTDENSLHSQALFGYADTVESKMDGRDMWGWIKLETDLIHPIWLDKGSLAKTFVVANAFIPRLGTQGNLRDILKGKLYVLKRLHPNGQLSLFSREQKLDASGKQIGLPWMGLESDEDRMNMSSGMDALIWIFHHVDANVALNFATLALNNYVDKQIEKFGYHAEIESDRYVQLLKDYRYLDNFVKRGDSLVNYVINCFPVMPQSFRPILEGSGIQEIPDFDWHYKQIIKSASNVQAEPSEANKFELYERIRLFTGLGDLGSKKDQKYQTILSYFTGKNKSNHGKLREALQSKRLFSSGRAPIIPTQDTSMSPLEAGIPASMLVKMFELPLVNHFKSKVVKIVNLRSVKWSKLFLYLSLQNKNKFRDEFNKNFSQIYEFNSECAYDSMLEWMIHFFEGNSREGLPRQVVILGRQPSLHKYSTRGFYVRVVFTKAIQLHTLLCTGFNADFDGDQMWVTAMLTEASRKEAIELLSAGKDFINPKNSSIILEHSQDVALGVYCATMYKNNQETANFSVDDINYYSSIVALQSDVEADIIHTYDLVCLNIFNCMYLSTAGRILFNSLLMSGFTDEPYENTMQITGIDTAKFKKLQYDGIITCGKAGGTNLRYYNLQKICKELYLNTGEDCIYEYQAISEFGFYYSDKFGVSLSWEDLEISNNKDTILAEAASLKELIEQDFQDGLIEAKDKKKAVISLYTDSMEGANKKVLKSILSNLDRNNNVFIMMDSGARGNTTQLMHMTGAIGILQKTKTEDMEDAVTNNYYEGLSSFDVHMTSYSIRTGFASTQNETSGAGYATRQIVNMTSGSEIVEEDCHKEMWWFETIWGDRIEEKDTFIPSGEWFQHNLLGRKVLGNYADTIEFPLATDGTIRAENFPWFEKNGLRSIELDIDGRKKLLEISPETLVGFRLLEDDSENFIYVKNLLIDGKITRACLDIFNRKRVRTVKTTQGIFCFSYELDKSCKSLLINREARNLPFLRDMRDKTYGKTISVITEQTLQWIEEEGLAKIEARIMLDCNSVHGVCAHCYGLKYSNLQLPKIGEYVGTESAQATGEPSAQLVISLINQGGAAGKSVSSGVETFDALLKGSLPGGSSGAYVAENNGYVSIVNFDKTAAVRIEPDDKTCDACCVCKRRCQVETCPLFLEEDSVMDPGCLITDRIFRDTLCVVDGEWVAAGDPITTEMILPNSIKRVGKVSEPAIVLRKKQMVWLLNYYNTFINNNIDVNARHFELIARLQNLFVLITKSENGNFLIGEVYEFTEVLKAGDESIKYLMSTSKQSDVILKNSGALTALSFADNAGVAAALVCKGIKSSNKHNNGPVGLISVGADMITKKLKILSEPKISANVEYAEDVLKKRMELDDIFLPDVLETGLTGVSLSDMLSNSLKFDVNLLDAFDVAMPLESIEQRTNHIVMFDEENLATFNDETEQASLKNKNIPNSVEEKMISNVLEDDFNEFLEADFYVDSNYNEEEETLHLAERTKVLKGF